MAFTSHQTNPILLWPNLCKNKQVLIVNGIFIKKWVWRKLQTHYNQQMISSPHSRSLTHWWRWALHSHLPLVAHFGIRLLSQIKKYKLHGTAYVAMCTIRICFFQTRNSQTTNCIRNVMFKALRFFKKRIPDMQHEAELILRACW